MTDLASSHARSAMGALEKRFVNSGSHSKRVAAHAARLLRTVATQPGERYLDVGCGNGAASAHVAEAFGLDVTGVDVDPQQILAASTHYAGSERLRFHVADARALPFEDGEFDIVFSNKVTHHIPDWPGGLAEMARVLRPGGHLVYSDLVLPLGLRLPTKRALDRLADENRLRPLRRSGSPFHYTAIWRKET